MKASADPVPPRDTDSARPTHSARSAEAPQFPRGPLLGPQETYLLRNGHRAIDRLAPTRRSYLAEDTPGDRDVFVKPGNQIARTQRGTGTYLQILSLHGWGTSADVADFADFTDTEYGWMRDVVTLIYKLQEEPLASESARTALPETARTSERTTTHARKLNI